MKKRLTVAAVVILITGSCGRVSDDSCFNGQIRLIDDIKVEKITPEEINLDGPFWGNPTVCDSFMIFWNTKLTKSFFQVFNLHTGAYIGDFVDRGGGPGEVYTLPYIFQVYEEGGSMKTLLNALHEQKLLVWNISRSVKHGEAIMDTVIPYERDPGNDFFNYMFRLSDDTLVARLDSEMLTMDGDIASTPYYQKRTIYSNQPAGDIRIYNRPTVQKGDVAQIPIVFYYGSSDCVKPDRTKIAQAMSYLCQINIIDLATGRITGHRIKNTPDFSVFYSGVRNIKQYYRRIQADDNYIYALYVGEIIDFRSSENKDPYLVHVFDWNGNLVKKLDLGHPIREMAIDAKNNALYFLEAGDDILYRCDLNVLNWE
ncbi:MAG: TolB-like 6-bladed beta-propeller domain-containing protein [Tannerella sp.]|jgi:hypothetical protein|nr:TolB-like 6-bladed beta-propeller domain-containing protein [Tannerella sp.]